MGHAHVRPYISVTHLHKWRSGWVSMMVSPHCWVLNRGCWQCFPPCSGQIWRSDSGNDWIMSIDIAGLACTVLSSTRRRPHYNRSPGFQPSELPLMVGAQQHHQPLVNQIKSHSTKGWSRWHWDRVKTCHSSLPPWPLPLPSNNRLGGKLLKLSCALIPSTWNTSFLAGTFSYSTN